MILSDAESTAPGNVADDSRLDPTFLHARREAIVIFLVWCVALVWSISICYWLGYGAAATHLATIWGVPAWVFWGIAAPWAVAVVFSLWFCFRYMVDDDLSGGRPADPAEPPDTGDQPKVAA
jgi:hypothetical protein